MQGSPVSQLSDDILGHILLFNVFNEPIGNWELSSITSRAISQVCRQWREVSLSLPLLWRNIEITKRHTRWTEELLHRSKSYSLRVVCLSDDPSILNSQLNPEHIARLVSFVGYLSERVWSQVVIDLQKPTSKLEFLDIHNSDPAIFTRVDISKTQPSSLKELYIDLDFRDPGFSWGSPLFVNLSILSITSTRHPADLILSALQPMALLTELTLSRALSSFGDLTNNSFRLPHVSLPKLRYLSIHDACASVGAFLACLEVPESCTVDAVLRKASIGPVLMSISSLLLKKFIQTYISESQTNPSLKITINQIGSILFSNTPPGPYYSGPWAVYDKNFKKQFCSLRLLFEGEWLPYLHHFTSSLETIIPSIKSLSLDLINIADVSELPLRAFTGVNHLCLKNDNIMGRVIELLSARSSDDTIFPSLDRLTLVPRHNAFNRCFDDFIACLRSRESTGHTIKILELCPEWYAYNKGQFDERTMLAKLESLTKIVPLYHMADGLLVKTSFWDDLPPKNDVRGVLPFQPVSDDWSDQFLSARRLFDSCDTCDESYVDGSMSDSYESD